MKFAVKIEPDKQKLQDICDAGFEHAEIYTSNKFITKEYITLLTQFPIEYSVHAPVQYCDESVFDYAQALNAKTVTVHCTYTFDELEDLAQRAASRGLSLCLENEGVWGENTYEHNAKRPEHLAVIHSADDFVSLKKRLEFLSMTLDTEHSDMRGTTDSFWELVGNKNVKHMHLSGYDGTRGSWHSTPLNNESRFESTIKKLLSLNYQGMLTAEMHMKFHTAEIFRSHIDFYNKIVSEYESTNASAKKQNDCSNG